MRTDALAHRTPAARRAAPPAAGRRRRPPPWLGLIGALLLASLPPPASAVPFVPADDSVVVQRLPLRLGGDERARRQALSARPAQLSLALPVARAALDRARADGDPRELGAAQAALAAWWSMPRPPAPAWLLRASIRQSLHDFDGALHDLDGLVADLDAKPRPEDLALRAQAGFTRAAVLRATGRWDDVADTCRTLARPPLADLPGVAAAAEACLDEAASLRGDDAAAREATARLEATAGHGGWHALLRGELAQRQGDPATAVRHLWRALASADEVYRRVALADALLEQGRPDAVISLLGSAAIGPDALLLRRAIAWRRLGDPRATDDSALLEARFAAARLRGDRYHQREEALLALDLRGDPAAAVQLALENWRQQREPFDVLLLARSGAAAADAQALSIVRDLQSAGWRDRRLDAVMAQAQSARPAASSAGSADQRTPAAMVQAKHTRP